MRRHRYMYVCVTYIYKIARKIVYRVRESDFEDDFQPQISRESSRWNAPPRFPLILPLSRNRRLPAVRLSLVAKIKLVWG